MPSRPKLADPGSLIRSAKLPEKDFPVCVDPDLVGEYEQLVEERDAAKSQPRDSLASGGGSAELDAKIADVQKRMEASTVVLRLRALGRRRWKELTAEHPPRKDEDGKPVPADILLRVNSDTFFEPLVRESIISPELDEETLTLLIDERLTDAQWNDLTTVAWNLNEQKVSVPFSPAASPSRKTSA